MKKGWGYGKQSMSLNDKIKNGKVLKFENNNMKVYEYILNASAHTYFKDITIKYINNLNTKKKTIVLNGLYKSINYDCSKCKNQNELFEYVANTLIDLYIRENSKLEDDYFQGKENYMYCIKNMNYIDSLNNNEFTKFINKFFNTISEFKMETRRKIWNDIYKDIFNRSEYQDEDIVNLHCKYIELSQ